MNEVFLKQLANFGLSDKESKIYLAVLELELATVFEVAKHSGVNRSTAYVTLESLKKKGLVGVSDDKKVRQYVATSPEILLHSARNKAKKHEDILTGIESILPELKAIHRDTKHKPVVKVFEGKNGLINIFEDSTNSKEKVVRVMSSVEKIFDLLPDYFPSYVQNRVSKGVKMLGIHPLDSTIQKYMEMDIPTLDEPIVIPKEKYTSLADVAIYDDKIGYMTAENGGFGVIIESKDMAEAMKNIFDLAYEEAKRLNKTLGTSVKK